MKKILSTIVTGIFLAVIFTSHAAVLRVNNNPGIPAPYSTFAAAQSAALPGDTIYMEGTAVPYGNLYITKKIVLIGPGYFLNQNPQTQSNTYIAHVSSINFTSTAANGSKIIGIYIESTVDFTVNNLQDIELTRNYIQYVQASYYLSNILIKQNYINSSLYAINIHNSAVYNNFISSPYMNSPTSTVVVVNNVISSTNNLTNIIFSNNIQTGGDATLVNCNTSSNICSATQFPAGNSNQQNVAMGDVFVCWSNCAGYSSDGRYQLKAGSPAIGAGASSEDCGIYGGNEPYVLSGMPAIPAIYYFLYGNTNTDINVTMSAKSHN